MNVSQNCIELIAGFEGLRLDAYRDPVGIPTIGYGTIRYPDGTPVRMGDRITEDQAEAYLTLEAEKFARDISEIADGIALNQNQFDALVSFTYNVGIGAFKSSTLLDKLQEGDFDAAAKEFERWNKGTINGVKRVLPGLTIRRQTERALFERATDQGEPLPTEESAQDKAVLLVGFREGDHSVIVAKDGDGATVEIVELKSDDIDALGALLRQYTNATRFEIAAAGAPIPAGERIEFVVRERIITRPKQVPRLDQALLLRGNNDEETGHNDVEEMQRRLTDLGYYRATIDGKFGSATDDAVRRFQAAVFGIAEADGKVGPRTWEKLFASDQPPLPEPPPEPVHEGINYLRLIKTNRRDDHGLFVLELAYFKDGQLQDSIPACSGIRSRQFFRTAAESVPRTNEPLPEGRWTISDVQWKGRRDDFDGPVWSSALGPAKIFMCYEGPGATRRSHIEIHMDWNKRGAPGTAGCLGIHTVADFKRMLTWLRDTDPRSLYVDWGCGTCPEPQAPAATSEQNPCVWDSNGR